MGVRLTNHEAPRLAGSRILIVLRVLEAIRCIITSRQSLFHCRIREHISKLHTFCYFMSVFQTSIHHSPKLLPPLEPKRK